MDMKNIEIHLSGEVTAQQYDKILEKIPGICDQLGLTADVMTNFSYEPTP